MAHPPYRRLHTPAWRGLSAVFLCLLLQACGGGGSYEDPPATVGPPDCKNHPELCK
jgi:hypothetical protein